MRTFILHSIICAAALLSLSCAFGDRDAANELFTGTDEKGPLFVAVGLDGALDGIYISKEGTVWTNNRILNPIASTLWCVGYGNGRFLASGENGNYYTSLDDLLWPLIGNYPGGAGTFIYKVRHYNNLFFAVGNPGAGGAVWVSQDGIIPSSNLVSGVSNTLYDIAYGSGVYVAVGLTGDAAISIDGFAWSYFSIPPGNNFTCIAYGKEKFVVFSGTGAYQVSFTGVDWSPSNWLTAGSNVSDIVYGGDQFVAVGDDGGFAAIWVSKDGLVWIQVLPLSYPDPIYGVTYCNGKYVAVGNSGGVYNSENGYDWRQISLPGAPALFGVACRP